MKTYHFTLLELLIVIFIIGILLGLVTEVFSQSRNKVYEISCMNNLSQINLMCSLFSNDNSNYSLPASFYPSEGDKVSFLTTLLNQQYTKDTGCFICPEMDSEKLFNPNDFDGDQESKVDNASYIMNVVDSFRGAPTVPYYSRGWSRSSNKLLHNSQVKSPETVFFILDALERPDTYSSAYHWSNDMSSLGSWQETDHGLIPTTSGANKRDVGTHHSDFSFNVLFGDGSVKNLQFSQTENWIVTHE